MLFDNNLNQYFGRQTNTCLMVSRFDVVLCLSLSRRWTCLWIDSIQSNQSCPLNTKGLDLFSPLRSAFETKEWIGLLSKDLIFAKQTKRKKRRQRTLAKLFSAIALARRRTSYRFWRMKNACLCARKAIVKTMLKIPGIWDFWNEASSWTINTIG